MAPLAYADVARRAERGGPSNSRPCFWKIGISLAGSGTGSAWNRCAQFFEEKNQPAGYYRDHTAPWSTADILKSVASPARRKHGSAWASVNLAAIHLEQEVTLKNVPPFILLMMQLKRRTFHGLGPALHNRKGPVRILTGDFYRDIITDDVQRTTGAIAAWFDYESCCFACELVWLSFISFIRRIFAFPLRLLRLACPRDSCGSSRLCPLSNPASLAGHFGSV